MIPPAQTDPFIAELRCLEVDGNQHPVARNDLIGKAVISRGTISDEWSYAAIGIRSNGVNNGDTTLCLGDSSTGPCAPAEYAACADSLSVNIVFDGAVVAGRTAENELTLVPCSAMYLSGAPMAVAATLFVDNEFEVRTSAGTVIRCADASSLAVNVVNSATDDAVVERRLPLALEGR